MHRAGREVTLSGLLHDPGRWLGGMRIDPHDVGMGVRRGQCGHVEHTGQDDIVDVVALTQYKAFIFNGWKVTANPLPIRRRYGTPHGPYGWRFTGISWCSIMLPACFSSMS
jgi:hypothetical protein